MRLCLFNSNCMSICYRFQDISPFNNLLIKLISLISLVLSGPNSIGYDGYRTRVNKQSKLLCVYLAPF